MTEQKIKNPLLAAWDHYRSCVYPHTELSEVQHNECQQAFYAGYAEALNQAVDIFDYPPEKGLQVLRERIAWLLRYHQKRAEALDE